MCAYCVGPQYKRYLAERRLQGGGQVLNTLSIKWQLEAAATFWQRASSSLWPPLAISKQWEQHLASQRCVWRAGGAALLARGLRRLRSREFPAQPAAPLPAMPCPLQVVNDGMIDGHAQHRSNEASQAADEAPRRAASSGTTSSTAPKDPVTTWKCYRMGAWGDVCVYNNICFDGSFWTFLDPTSENVNLGAPPTVFGRRDMLEGYLVPYRRVPDVDDQTFPFNSGECRVPWFGADSTRDLCLIRVLLPYRRRQGPLREPLHPASP